jgi:DNA-binding response OmpR family regulator
MKTILIVDDDRKSAAGLTIRLKAAGYRVLSAADGIEGLKLAIQHQPDLIVMDIWMPFGIGILTAQRLKHIGLASVPVIFVTASRKQDLWAIVEEVEPAGFFEKPYDAKALAGTIEMLLTQAGPVPVAAKALRASQACAL